MESAKELHIEALIDDELARIIEEHGLFVDDHQAYAVIKEEVEEAREEMIIIRENMVKFWERVRQDDANNTDIMESIQIHGTELIKEAVQIVACAKKHDWGRLQEWMKKVRP